MVAKSLRENLAFIWISGNQTPDFRTLNNFRLRLKDDIKRVFKYIVQYALEQGIIEAKDVFVDHTKNEANANKHKMVWRKHVEKQSGKIDEELDELFRFIDELNEKEEKMFGGKDLPEQERDGFDGEKVRRIVDGINKNMREGVIDREEGCEQRKKVRRVKQLVERKEKYELERQVLGGRNSYSRTDIDAVAMMMKDKLTIRPGYNDGVKLVLDKEEGNQTKTGYVRKIKMYKASGGFCANCPFRARCVKGKDRYLQVSWKAEMLKQQARENLDSDKGKELRKRRGYEVESVFGDEKLNKLKRRYHLRGLKKVNLEAGLYYIAHNIRRISGFFKRKPLMNRYSNSLYHFQVRLRSAF